MPQGQAVTKIYDVIKWLIPQVMKFPRSHKFTLGDRITNLVFDILELLLDATYTKSKLNLLWQANVKLEKLRYFVRLCKDFDLLSLRQYKYISGEINEVGKRIGGWIKQQQSKKS